MVIREGQFGTFIDVETQGVKLDIDGLGVRVLDYADVLSCAPKLGYAITDSESRETDFRHVIVVCDDSPSCNKKWLYTAFSQARDKLAWAELTNIQKVLNKPVLPRLTQRLVPFLN